MQIYSNKSIKALSLLTALAAAGCSQSPKNNLSIDYNPPVANPKHNYLGHSTYRSKPARPMTAQIHNTVWERMFALYSLPEIKHERIDREINWYLRHPDDLALIQQRAAPYLHHILDEIEARNIPGELALLPVVESSFIPEAYSKSDASGLWQFIPSTGKLFGLQQNSWYDGRRDVYASTKAATEYLKQLCETFDGDWLLALASYNWGKGNVRKSIEKNLYLDLPTDYWSLNLPEETTNYVPRLLAISRIFAHADDYGIPLVNIPNKPYFEVVNLHGPIDLDKAATLANTPFHEFKKLNPGFNRWCTAPDGPHRLLIPVRQASEFKRNLAQLPYDQWLTIPPPKSDSMQLAQESSKRYEAPSPKRQSNTVAASNAFSRYRVRPGETLTAIARNNQTTVAALIQANHLKKSSVNSGAVLKIPGQAKSRETSLLAKSSKDNTFGTNKYHIVKKGDTFWNIAQRYGVSTNDLAAWNHLKANSALILGKKLTIKNKDTQVASDSPIRLIKYTVKAGDSLMQISRKFNVSLSELRKSNAETLTRGLRPGQKLKILVEGNPAI